MDNKNNKLEDFFNQSINHFDDSPSDAVWEGLQERLDNDMTIWDKITTSLRKYFPYLILLLGLSTYHFFAQNKINTFQDRIDKIQTENSTLNLQLNECDKKSTSLFTDIQSTSAALQQSKQQIGILEQKLFSANNTTNQLQDKLTNAYTNATALQNQMNHIEATSIQNTIPIILPTEQIIVNQPKELIPFPEKLAELKDSKLSESDFKRNLSTFSTRRPSKLTPRGLLMPNALSRIIPFMDPEPKVKFSKFRIGYEFKGFHVVSNTNSDVINFGHTNGAKLEWVIKNKFALTGGINFVDQTYKVKNSNNPIPVSQLLRYPEGTSFGLDVNEIDVENNYFEFPVGIRFPVKYFNDNFGIYLNPAVVWQFHLPQNYEYNSSLNSIYKFKNEQYFGYLGSAQMTLGLEKTIHKKLVWQLGLYGEKSLIGFGAEDQNFSAFGISSSILFQK